jgi:hypothetical protein
VFQDTQSLEAVEVEVEAVEYQPLFLRMLDRTEMASRLKE